jgi:hypothetical protein
MNYRKIYFLIVKRAKNRKECPDDFCEKHHVIPNSFIKNNIKVTLTTKEHYLCHKLIYKYCNKRYGKNNKRTQKALIALFFLSNRMRINSSRNYQTLRNEYILYLRNKRRKIRTFYHEDFGEFTGTIKELCNKYPDLNPSLIFMVSSGDRNHHKGWCLNKEISEKIKNKEHLKRKIYKFVHDEHGVFEGSIFQMKKVFKDMDLNSSYLGAVFRGKRNHHKGWKRVDFCRKKIKWTHNIHGNVEAEITELSNLYPDLKLNKAHLSSVSNGKLRQHKGWKLLNE